MHKSGVWSAEHFPHYFPKQDISRFSRTQINFIYTRVIPSLTPLESSSLDQYLAQLYVGPDLVPELFAKVNKRQPLQPKD